jgi:hypothetical protein
VVVSLGAADGTGSGEEVVQVADALAMEVYFEVDVARGVPHLQHARFTVEIPLKHRGGGGRRQPDVYQHLDVAMRSGCLGG